MRFVLLLFLVGWLASSARSQVSNFDLLMESGSAPVASFGMKAKVKPFLRYNPVYWLMNGALTGYQKVVSPQLSASCLYDLSCSRFSRASISTFGILKGLALTADRLSRCNRVSATSIEQIRINSATGRVVDTPEMYRVRHEFDNLKIQSFEN